MQLRMKSKGECLTAARLSGMEVQVGYWPNIEPIKQYSSKFCIKVGRSIYFLI